MCCFYRGEDDARVICACLGKTAPRYIFPGEFGSLEVQPCPLEMFAAR
jgi:hypothetical protein